MTYEYECSMCGRFEVQQSIHDEALTNCECGRPVERIISGGYGFNMGTRTLGGLADKRHKDGQSKKPPKETPWWRTGPCNHKLANLTPDEQQTYIEKGTTYGKA